MKNLLESSRELIKCLKVDKYPFSTRLLKWVYMQGIHALKSEEKANQQIKGKVYLVHY